MARIAVMSDNRLVYSTDGGDQRRAKSARGANPVSGPPLPRDGVVRVFREKGGRGGKTVTVVRGLDGELAAVASDLKRHCGSGGAVKGGAIEIQGDHREKVVARLRSSGYRAKLAGG
jgi:translation initiation factor 1